MIRRSRFAMRPDRRVLLGEESAPDRFHLRAQMSGKTTSLLEGIVVEDLIEKADQLVQLLSFLVITWIRNRSPSFAR